MNNQAAALIANALPNLQHPGDGNGAIALPIAAFQMGNLPPEVADQFAREAGYPHADIPKLVAEAIVSVIETQYAIVPIAEIDNLRAVTPQERQGLRSTYCHCGTRLFSCNVIDANTDKPKVSGPELIKAIRTLGVECATGHRA